MNEIVIPTAVNWFNDDILSATGDGSKLAYGSKNEIIVLSNLNQDPTDVSKCETTIFPIGVKNVISAVRFAPVDSNHAYSDFLASAGNDGKVRLWNLKNSSVVSYHTGHMSPKGNEEIKGMDWSNVDPEMIVTVASSGSIVLWKLNVNVINRYSLKGKMSPQCVACCPANKDLIAIGTKSGLFIVYSLKDSGSILWSLRGHDADIVSVAWCPAACLKEVKDGEKKENEKTPLVVATASKDCSVTIWRNKVSELTFNLVPVSRSTGSQCIRHVCLCWPTPNTIVAGTHQGDLKLLKLSGDPKTELKGTKTSITDLPAKHNKCVFSLTYTPVPSDAGAGGDATPPITVWSASIDRSIIGFNLTNTKKQIVIPTLTQIVYCMAFNPINNSQLAIGVGNGEIIVWNVSTKTSFDTTFHKSKIMAKVMALAWHPSVENLLAFGTGEGRVGIINTTSPKSSPVILKLAHSSSVYTLSWAPPLNYSAETLKHGLSLFSVGNGDIVEHNPDDPFAAPIKLNKTLSAADESFSLSMRFQRTEMAWNHDSSAVAIGNENGYVHILDGNWKGLQTVYAHKKIIQSLAWHPKIISDDAMTNLTSWKNILATASHQIKVYDFSEGLDKEPKVVVSFAHADECRVTTVAWSPFIPYRLLTTSYDNSAQIWDVLNKTALANFPGHTGYVMCGLWSPLENDTVYTGGADCKIFVWKTTAQTHTKPIERKKRKEMINKYQLTNVVEAKYGNVNFNAEPISPEHNNLAIIEKNKKSIPKLKTLFPLTAPHLTEGKSLSKLISQGKENDTKVQNGTVPEVSYLSFFGDRNDMINLLEAEQARHTEAQNLDGEQFCRFWKGDVSALVRDSIHKKQISEWILGLAPMASHKLWLEACVAYAFQIALDQPLRAASYLVAANEIQEAVNILMGKHMHREAVAIAKCHWASDDARLENLMRNWAEHATSNGHFSLAAHCYYSINDKTSAINCILKCKDPKLRSQAAILAEEASTPLVVDDIITDCFLDCLGCNHVVNAESILGQRKHLNHLTVWLEAYKYCSQNIPLDWKAEKAWLSGERKSTAALKDLESILKNTLASDKEGVYMKLSKIVDSINVENRSKLLMYVSGQLALLLSSSANSVKLNHLVNALSSSYKLQVQNPQYHYTLSLYALLCPEGPRKLGALEQSFDLLQSPASCVVQSLYFYLSAAIISWLNANLNFSEALEPGVAKSSDKNKRLEPEVCVSIVRSLEPLVPKILSSGIISHYKELAEAQKTKSKLFTVSINDSISKLENPSEKANGNDDTDPKRLLQAQFIAVPDPDYVLSSIKSTLENDRFSTLIGASEPELASKIISGIDQFLKGFQISPTV